MQIIAHLFDSLGLKAVMNKETLGTKKLQGDELQWCTDGRSGIFGGMVGQLPKEDVVDLLGQLPDIKGFLYESPTSPIQQFGHIPIDTVAAGQQNL